MQQEEWNGWRIFFIQYFYLKNSLLLTCKADTKKERFKQSGWIKDSNLITLYVKQKTREIYSMRRDRVFRLEREFEMDGVFLWRIYNYSNCVASLVLNTSILYLWQRHVDAWMVRRIDYLTKPKQIYKKVHFHEKDEIRVEKYE